jgi:hypothetical protein
MPRPLTHRDFAIAVRLLREYRLSYAETWRQLVPVAMRFGVARPSYATVRRLYVAHARRGSRVAFVTAVSGAVAGVAAAQTLRIGRRAVRRRRAIPLRE